MKYAYFMPTKIFFGKNCVDKNANLLKEYGKKALIVTGKTASKTNGALSDMCSALNRQNISWDIFDGVVSNPSVENVRQGAEIAKSVHADFIIGIGGGSPMDAAKAIAVLAVNDVDNDALFQGKFKKKNLPIIAVPTTAGTGSEVTPYAILTYHKIQNKANLTTETLFPKIAFLDASYMMALPYHLTVNTALDALSHAIEGFLSSKSTRMSDFFALQSLDILGESLPSLNPDSFPVLHTREKLLHASMLAGMVIAQTGTTIVHAMGYCLTYYKNIDHGRANALLMREYLRYVSLSRSEAVNWLLDILNFDTLAGFQMMMDRLLGHRETLTDEEIKKFSMIALEAASTRKTDPIPSLENIEKIYRNSMTTP